MWGCLSNDSPTNHHFGFGRPAEGLKGKKKIKVGPDFFFFFRTPTLTLGANFFYYFLSPPILLQSFSGFVHWFPLYSAIMSDEVYEGAIGIDLGKLTVYLRVQQQLITYPPRHDLLLCRQLWRHQCRNQYVVYIYPWDLWTRYWFNIVANEQGSYTTPSFVSFTDKERLIGEAAKNQAAMNPRNTIFDIK